MHLRHTIAPALASLALLAATAPAAGAASQPTGAQISKAVNAAERSSDLWATVNLCNTRRFKHELGLRAQMPALGFSSDLYMTFEVYYRSAGRFKLDRSTTQYVALGSQSGATLHQSGVTFTFKPPAMLEGKVVFTWRRGGKVIGQTTRTTSAHHKHVDFGDPKGHSAATCSIS